QNLSGTRTRTGKGESYHGPGSEVVALEASLVPSLPEGRVSGRRQSQRRDYSISTSRRGKCCRSQSDARRSPTPGRALPYWDSGARLIEIGIRRGQYRETSEPDRSFVQMEIQGDFDR